MTVTPFLTIGAADFIILSDYPIHRLRWTEEQASRFLQSLGIDEKLSKLPSSKKNVHYELEGRIPFSYFMDVDNFVVSDELKEVGWMPVKLFISPLPDQMDLFACKQATAHHRRVMACRWLRPMGTHDFELSVSTCKVILY